MTIDDIRHNTPCVDLVDRSYEVCRDSLSPVDEMSVGATFMAMSSTALSELGILPRLEQNLGGEVRDPRPVIPEWLGKR